jgi:hypothetical protein
MPAVQMRFVDAQDNSPIAGAVVLFQNSAREGTWTGHGGRSASLFAVEGVTSEAGEVRFPRQDFSSQPFFLNTNYESPSMVALKSGYALLVLTNPGAPDLKGATTWEYDNQTIKMSRITEGRQISDAIYLAGTYADRTMGSGSLCGWKKIPRFLVAIERLTVDWNRKQEQHADSALRRPLPSNPLRRTLMNDQLYVDKGCGSPKAFFEPYLR